MNAGWVSRIETLIRQLQGQMGGRRMRGSVTSAGAVGSGSGFTASRAGTGLYTVTFTVAFPSAPYVFPVANISGGVRAITVSAFSTTAFSVEIRNDAATLADSAFFFEVVEH